MKHKKFSLGSKWREEGVRMGFYKLSQTGFIHEFIDVSDGPHSSKFCFVLGAGASKSSGIKMGQELVDIWERELKERNPKDYEAWKKKLEITDENKYSHYSQYYEKRFEKRPIDGLNFLEKMMENVNPSVGYVVLSYILTHKQHNVVITTNFDHLTEDAVNYYEKILPLIIGHESLAHYITKQISRPTIIKIHRDLLFDPKNTSKDVETLHEAWEKSLGLIFSEYHPVFIGYAGNDNSLMNYLIENAGKFKNGEWKFPYWTLYKSAKPEGNVEKFLNKTEGYCINCNGFDELLCMLGAELGYKKPIKKVFLDDAKKRFYELTEAFENIVSNKKSSDKNEWFDSDSKEDTNSDALNSALQKMVSNADNFKYFSSIMLHNQGRYDEALTLKKELIQKYPNNSRYHNSLGVTLYEMGQYEAAAAEIETAIEIEPGNAEYHDSLSATLHKLGRYEEAEQETRRAIEIEPGNAEYHDSLSATLHKLGRYEEAAAEKRRAIEIDPDDAGYHNSLGITLHKMKKYKEAAAEKRRAVEIDPDNARYHNSLGVTLHGMKKYEEAVAEKRKAVEIEPDNARYHDSLSTTLHEMGRYEEAEQETRRAIEIEPDNAEYHNSLCITLYKMEEYEEAEKAVRKALDLDPDNEEYQDNLDEILKKINGK